MLFYTSLNNLKDEDVPNLEKFKTAALLRCRPLLNCSFSCNHDIAPSSTNKGLMWATQKKIRKQVPEEKVSNMTALIFNKVCHLDEMP